MNYFDVHLDHKTSARAGADGTFQVASITDDKDEDKTNLVDQGTHYHDLDSLANDIAKALKVGKSTVKLNVV